MATIFKRSDGKYEVAGTVYDTLDAAERVASFYDTKDKVIYHNNWKKFSDGSEYYGQLRNYKDFESPDGQGRMRYADGR